MDTSVTIERATTIDMVRAAEPAFDHPVRPEAAQRFLTEPGHHLLVARDGGEGVGFVSGVETVHPDKGCEMFLYELGVVDDHQGRGIGRALVGALADLARERGCYGMWVLTERTNPAALAAYAAAGGADAGDCVLLEWRL